MTRSHADISLYRLRITATQEWHDLYQPDTIADMKRFLDHYTKRIQNNWEATPRARVSILRFNQVGLCTRPPLQ